MIQKYKLYEKVITNNSEEIQSIEEFSDGYKDLVFELIPVENRIRAYDTLIGKYKSKSTDLEVDVTFYENDNGSWTIEANGFSVDTNNNLDVSFSYDEFSDMIFNLKTLFLNLEENSSLPVWVCKNEFELNIPQENE